MDAHLIGSSWELKYENILEGSVRIPLYDVAASVKIFCPLWDGGEILALFWG